MSIDTHAERERRFRDFHAANPHVYRELLSLAREAKANGARKIGIRMLWEVMRWNQRGYLATDDPNSAFKLNDHYPPFYARLLIAEHPELEGLFEVRGRAAAVESRRADVSPRLHGAAPDPAPADTDLASAASPEPTPRLSPPGVDSGEAPDAPRAAAPPISDHPPSLNDSPMGAAAQLFPTTDQEFDAIAPPAPRSPYDTREAA